MDINPKHESQLLLKDKSIGDHDTLIIIPMKICSQQTLLSYVGSVKNNGMVWIEMKLCW